MKQLSQKLLGCAAVMSGLVLSGCGSHKFDLGFDQNGFTQNSKAVSVPIDILWVIDNSGSMATSQLQVATNVSSFINKFKQTNFDYQIAVTTTGAYQSLPLFGGASSWSRFSDGTDDTSHSGVRIITPNTPNIEGVFQTNILQGITGSADERSLQSLEATLLNLDNRASFPRPGAFLAVIFLTDEEDFSWEGTANIQLTGTGAQNSNTDSRLLSPLYLMDFLDTLTESTANKRNYMVNTIAIFSQECLNELSTSFSGRRTADRLAQLSDATGGVKASLCDDFSGILSNITDTILIQTTKFTLNRKPKVSTLQIFVNEVEVPTTGWDYNESENSVSFHADTIPPKDALIRVKFQPAELL